MSKDSSIPAFPIPHVPGQEGHEWNYCGGMSLRDWYATHAPYVPAWFQSSFNEPEPYDPSPFGDESIDVYNEQKLVHAAWSIRKGLARETEWRWLYADAMLKARES